MMEKMEEAKSKSFYGEAPAVAQAVFAIASFAMVGLSLYLTTHYYTAKFPMGVGAGSALCDLNSFFTCDMAAYSPASNILGVPISLLGLLMGVFNFAGYLFPSVEGTQKRLLLLNGAVCVLLLVYSLAVLRSLCLMCGFYYVASFASAFLMWRHSRLRDWGAAPLLGYAAVVLLVGGAGYLYTQKRSEKRGRRVAALLKSYRNLRYMGDPKIESKYRLASGAVMFGQTPVQITKFSDFECPACQMFSKTLHKLARMRKYRGKINLQYFFYPLDVACNPAIKRPFHKNACRAAYLAACLPDRFAEIEKYLFDRKDSFSKGWIENLARERGVFDCYKSQETQNRIKRHLSAASDFNVRSTPTWLLNGRKIEGPLSLNDVEALLDSLLK